MFKIGDILDIKKVETLINERLLAVNSALSQVIVHEARAVKKNFHNDYYNLVAAYQVSALEAGIKKDLVIYCSAHSNESRRQTMANLQLLWQKKIPNNQFQANYPLFYEPGCNALFYIGLPGRNLYQYLHEGDQSAIDDNLQATAKWLARLHQTTLGMTDWPNGRQQRIVDVTPGQERAMERIKQVCPEYYERFARLYNRLEQRELSHWPEASQLAMIHGDLHPENIIVNQQGAAIIDWADASLGDPARDLGSFIQQLLFMGRRIVGDEAYWRHYQEVFLQAYYQSTGLTPTVDWQRRLDTYYYFTAFRTAIYFVTKSGPEPERADGLLNEVEANLN